MSHGSSAAAPFVDTLRRWLQSQDEILVLIRYAYAGGAKSFELFSSFQALSERLHGLPPHTSVIAFRQPQLPLRGVVDEVFINSCVGHIQEGEEYLVIDMKARVFGRASWLHHGSGNSHAELIGELGDLRGQAVAVGLYPPWMTDTDDVVSAIVPDEHGVVRSGAY